MAKDNQHDTTTDEQGNEEKAEWVAIGPFSYGTAGNQQDAVRNALVHANIPDYRETLTVNAYKVTGDYEIREMGGVRTDGEFLEEKEHEVPVQIAEAIQVLKHDMSVLGEAALTGDMDMLEYLDTDAADVGGGR